MQDFIPSVVSNVAVAGALALLALGVTRIWRDPHLAHALWLLVLLKLVTPPIVQAPVPQWLSAFVRENGEEESDATKRLPASALPREPGDAASTALLEPHDAASASLLESGDAASPLPVVLPIVWLGGVIWLAGALAWLGILLRRYLRFSKLLVASAEADSQLRADARRLASAIGLASCPAVRVIDARIPPLVWSVVRRPVILLPLPVLARLNAAQRETVLLHELAHVRRRDHWVRWFELLVMVLYWWNPIVWWASRQIRQAEEECCDAWVVWALPECRRSYGQALLQTVEYLTENRAVPAVVGNAFGGFLFKRRIEMILKRRMNPKMSRLIWATVLLLGAIVLPVAAQQPGTNDQDILQETLVNPRSASTFHDDKRPGANRRLEERVKRLETLLGDLQEALKSSTESLERGRSQQMRMGDWIDGDGNVFDILGRGRSQQGGANPASTGITGPEPRVRSQQIRTGGANPAAGDRGTTSSDSLIGLTSKDYPLTAKEADSLASLLKAFGNKHVYFTGYLLFNNGETGTAAIKTTAEGHRRIAALLQLLRKEGGDIHFVPLTDQEIQEQRLRQEHLLREKNRDSK